MKTETLTRMAREAGFVGFDGSNKMLRKFAALVAAAEREACAKVCEDAISSNQVGKNVCTNLAAAIRARGE